jgi:hypothetical protein
MRCRDDVCDHDHDDEKKMKDSIAVCISAISYCTLCRCLQEVPRRDSKWPTEESREERGEEKEERLWHEKLATRKNSRYDNEVEVETDD